MATGAFHGPLGGWDASYRGIALEKLPWNNGGADPDAARAAAALGPGAGRLAIDVGCGLGYDAVELARQGFRVVAFDLSETALAFARALARDAGVEIEFRLEDVLTAKLGRGKAALINDRATFHVFDPKDRSRYARRAAAALAEGGTLLLRTFSEKEPPGPGPYRLSRTQLRRVFAKRFSFARLERGVLGGPRQAKTWFAVLKKKTSPYRRMLKVLAERKRGPKEWSVYVARCADGSLYTGVAKDAAARIETHNSGRGAAYTRTRRPVELLYREDRLTRGEALVREAAVKKLPRQGKLKLVGYGAPSKSSSI